MIHLLRRTRRHRLVRSALVTTLSLLLPAQDLMARGGGFGGGGFHGGGGGFHGGGGGFHGGGGGFGGGGRPAGGGGFGGGYHGGAGGGGGRPFNPGASHSFGGGGGHPGGGFGGGGMGGNRPPVTGGGGRGGIGGSGIGGGGIGGGGRGGEGIGGRGGQGIGGGGRGGEGIGGRGGNQGIGNRGGNQGIGNRGGNNIGNRSGNNFNRGNTNIGNNVNINNNHFNNGAWGNHYGNFHNYNNYWHHGYWHGGWGGWGWGGWGWGWGWGGLAAASLIGWGLGSMYSSSGYGGGYYNPYCGDCGSSSQAYLDYSQPIQPTAAPQTASTDGASSQPPSPEVAAALVPFDAAREAFKAGNYDESLKKVEEALQKLPSDAALHEFRALVLFALGRYKECASALYAVLSAGPGWDWTTLSSMYPNVDVYTKQLRTLEAFGKQNPDSPDAAFVMAYHYLTCGYKEAAAKELQTVIRLLPNDQLAPRLLNLVTGGAPQQGTEPAPGPQITPASPETPSNSPPDAQADSGPPVDRAKILGTWQASSGSDPHKVNIELTLKDDGNFTWKVTQGPRTNTIEGTYTLEVSTLDLKQKKDGDSMTGKVTLDDKGGFNFKLLETGPGDPGLNFSK